jgi:IS605 OrfB family transposase
MKTLIRKAYKYRLKVKPEQAEMLRIYAGQSRFVWNNFLAHNLESLQNRENLLWYNEMSFWLTFYKKTEELGWLKESPSQVLQQKLKDLEKAFKDAFDKNQPFKSIPVFKKKSDKQSFRFPAGFEVDQKNSLIKLPKVSRIKYFNSRLFDGKPKNITLSYQNGHWYASVQVEEMIETKPTQTSIVGIDLGVKRLFTDSNGFYVKPNNQTKTYEAKLAKLQRQLAKKVKFSNNWKKHKEKINKIHSKIARSRTDHLQFISTQLSKRHAMIVVEDLKVKNMSKSARGNSEKHGKQVKQKSGLNKAILDKGWGMFVNMLEYKQAWSGGEVLKVDPKYTSQTCPVCSHVSKENRQSQAVFECVDCGHKDNADRIGAQNVLERGHRLLACGETGLPDSVKQEPPQKQVA